MIFKNSFLHMLSYIGIISFFLMSSFGVYHIGMTMDENGMMNNCPFSLGTSVCMMTPLDHVSAAQSIFTAIFDYSTSSLFLLLVLSLVAIATLFYGLYSPPPRFLRRDSHSINGFIPPHSFLSYAFSDGILNSKEY